MDFGKVLVGLSNGLAKLYDVDTVEEVHSFGEASEGDSRFHCIREPS